MSIFVNHNLFINSSTNVYMDLLSGDLKKTFSKNKNIIKLKSIELSFLELDYVKNMKIVFAVF